MSETPRTDSLLRKINSTPGLSVDELLECLDTSEALERELSNCKTALNALVDVVCNETKKVKEATRERDTAQAAAAEMRPIVAEYARKNPKFVSLSGEVQDPMGAHAALSPSSGSALLERLRVAEEKIKELRGEVRFAWDEATFHFDPTYNTWFNSRARRIAEGEEV